MTNKASSFDKLFEIEAEKIMKNNLNDYLLAEFTKVLAEFRSFNLNPYLADLNISLSKNKETAGNEEVIDKTPIDIAIADRNEFLEFLNEKRKNNKIEYDMKTGELATQKYDSSRDESLEALEKDYEKAKNKIDEIDAEKSSDKKIAAEQVILQLLGTTNHSVFDIQINTEGFNENTFYLAYMEMRLKNEISKNEGNTALVSKLDEINGLRKIQQDLYDKSPEGIAMAKKWEDRIM